MELEKATIRLYFGDKEKLQEFYPKSGYNKVIRELVRSLVKKKEEELNSRMVLEEISINLEELE